MSPRARRRVKVALVGVLVVALAVVAVGAWRWWDARRDVLPDFVDAPAGPRAPAGTGTLAGVRVGASTVPEVEALAAARGISCRDTSMRALMRGQREEVQRAMQEAAARGDDPDGVTGASRATYRSKKERNPQVRLSCDPVSAAALADRPRGDDDGRLLVIFDSPAHPARHVSFARKVVDPARARDEWAAAVAAMRARFGEPTASLNGEPDDGFVRLKLFKREWRFADLRAEVTAMSFGARGIDVKETIEVPWPVRADAPAR